jgi:hypothetical protein
MIFVIRVIEQPGSSQRLCIESGLPPDTITSTAQPQTSGASSRLPANSDALRMPQTCKRCLHIKFKIPEFHHNKKTELCSFQRIGENEKEHIEQCLGCRTYLINLSTVQLPVSSSIATSSAASILQKVTYSA